MIEFRHVSKRFPDGLAGEVTAVDSLDLRIEDGEVHCLIGTSGCGKTTTMRMVNRLEEPTEGKVLVGGENVADVDPIRLRRRIGYVIQSGGLFPHMTVARNIALLCELEGWSRDRIQERVEFLMGLVNLPAEEFAHRHPGDLSGGQRQRVGVARALALDPEYVLMDEPFGALDPITRGEIRTEFEALLDEVRKTIVLVTHDLDEAFSLGDKISIMDAGRVVQTGTEQDLRERPESEFVERFLAGQSDTAGAARA